MTNTRSQLTGRARRMRQGSTDAEAKLWSRLRDRRLGGWKFRRQHPIGRYIVDFYSPASRLAVELDGGGHTGLRVSSRDAERTRDLEAAGVRVLRFWNDVVLCETDRVLELIIEALRTPSPLPSPPMVERGRERHA